MLLFNSRVTINKKNKQRVLWRRKPPDEYSNSLSLFWNCSCGSEMRSDWPVETETGQTEQRRWQINFAILLCILIWCSIRLCDSRGTTIHLAVTAAWEQSTKHCTYTHRHLNTYMQLCFSKYSCITFGSTLVSREYGTEWLLTSIYLLTLSHILSAETVQQTWIQWFAKAQLSNILQQQSAHSSMSESRGESQRLGGQYRKSCGSIFH